tara:strand:+ start:411 stop:644 length:234 start_codon:yes stop_codon:yes gene_type:complete
MAPIMKKNKEQIKEYNNEETEALIKEMKDYRDGMVVRNLPFQWISEIITRWEMKKVKTTSEQSQDELEPITSPMSDE